MYSRVAAKKLQLTLRDRLTRMRWCRRNRNRDWSRVVFTDEVRIGFRSDGRIRIWREAHEKFAPSCTTSTSKSRSSIMLWGFITASGVGMLLPCSNRMTAMEYISKMTMAAVPALPHFDLVYMDDNAPIHRASVVKDWKDFHGIECFDWPPYSPDLNLIENAWSHLKRAIKRLPRRSQTLEELSEAALRTWDTISCDYVHSLFGSMPNRVNLCLSSRGYPIRY